MDETNDSAKGDSQRNEIQKLIERCKKMEQELAQLKGRMLQIQKAAETDLERRKSNGKANPS
jgi:prefoldin subunit 5